MPSWHCQTDGMATVSADDIRAARPIVERIARRTPVLSTRTLSVVAQRDTTRKAVALRPARDAEEAASSYRPAGVGGRSR